MRTGALHKLSARTVKTAGDGMHSDGGGLFLRVRGESKSWVFRFTRDGRKREMGLGSLNAVSLARVRERAAQAREEVSEGRDPIAEKSGSTAVSSVSFKRATHRFIDLHETQWKNPKHRQQWRNTLDTYCGRLINMPVDKIGSADVVACLEPIWISKPETARRLRGRIERILSASIALGERQGPNPAGWKDNLQHILPRQDVTVVHHAAVPVADAPGAFQRLLEKQDAGQGYRALIFGILLALRSGEARRLKWSDIGDDIVTIPADRMKAGRIHRIPLCTFSKEFLANLSRMSGSDLVFPSSRNGIISDMTMAQTMRRSGLGEYTVHGWRSTFSDWANMQGFRRDFIEDALAHQIGSSVERAYRRGDFLEQRRDMMAAWAEYLTHE